MPATPDKVASNHDERDLYMVLIQEFPLRPLRSDAELERAIAMLDRLSDREELALEEEDYVDVLTDLVETYETEHDPEPVVSAADMLRHLIEAKGVTQAKVAGATGVNESTISEILSGKREVSRKAMHALADYFRVDPAVFI
ncbi:MAG: helix-turn-helix domain-containing protein [Planctomycetaceae bacterium]|nr:helix-turn-helix domain-containing protein [Planctomycetaceae bacterium]